jgi:DNA-binding response OmpR family regulator
MQEPSPDFELKVLLVEDDPAQARLVEALLGEAEEIAVAHEATLGAALDRLREEPFDAVLLDLSLPDAAGDDVIDQVRRVAPETAVVVSSGQSAADRLLVRAAVRKGADDLLPKAEVTTASLARVLTVAVERRRLLTAVQRHAADLATALTVSRIGHWSWRSGSRTLRLAGNLAAFVPPDGAPAGSASRPVRPLLRRLPRRGRRCLLAVVRALLAGRDRLVVGTLPGEGAGGRVAADLMVEATAERDSRGRLVRLHGVVTDLSQAADLEHLETQLITHLGHELRTPLTTIRGALGLLAHGAATPLTAATSTLVDNAIANADRIGMVIGETLDQAPEPLPGFRRQARRVPVGAFLYDALATRRPGLTAAGVALRLTPEARHVALPVDASRLRRALDALCGRLLAEGGEHGRFTLDVATERDLVWLRVAGDAAAAPPVDGSPVAAVGAPAATPASGAWGLAAALAA